MRSKPRDQEPVHRKSEMKGLERVERCIIGSLKIAQALFVRGIALAYMQMRREVLGYVFLGVGCAWKYYAVCRSHPLYISKLMQRSRLQPDSDDDDRVRKVR